MTETIRPDEVISPDNVTPVERPQVRDAIAALPSLVKLLIRLLKDSRVPLSSKALVVATIGYVFSPIDILPDVIPVVGQTDEILLIAYALSHLLRTAGEEVVVENWDGSQDVLRIIQGIVDLGADLVPKQIRRLLARFRV